MFLYSNLDPTHLTSFQIISRVLFAWYTVVLLKDVLYNRENTSGFPNHTQSPCYGRPPQRVTWLSVAMAVLQPSRSLLALSSVWFGRCHGYTRPMYDIPSKRSNARFSTVPSRARVCKSPIRGCRDMRPCTGTACLVAVLNVPYITGLPCERQFVGRDDLLKKFEPAPVSSTQALVYWVPSLMSREIRTRHIWFWKSVERVRQTSKVSQFLCSSISIFQSSLVPSSFLFGYVIIQLFLLICFSFVEKDGYFMLDSNSMVTGGWWNIDAHSRLRPFIGWPKLWCKSLHPPVFCA